MTPHVPDGDLRAMMDGALEPSREREAAAHVEACHRCSARASRIAARAQRTTEAMGALTATEPALTMGTGAAAEVILREERNMEHYHPVRRPALVSAVIVVAMGLLLAIPPVRTLAGQFLSLFRVQTLAVVEMESAAIPSAAEIEAFIPELDRIFEDDVTMTMEGHSRAVSPEEATAHAGYDVRLPSGDAPTALRLSPLVRLSLTIDLERIRGLVRELGYDSGALPETLDGQVVEVTVYPMVTAEYGACGPEGEGDGCITFAQMPAPDVYVPDELDLEELGGVYLQMLGMSARSARELAERTDWFTTLMLPMPQGSVLGVETVTVDGIEGVLIQPGVTYSPEEYLILWVRDGMTYALRGYGDPTPALMLMATL